MMRKLIPDGIGRSTAFPPYVPFTRRFDAQYPLWGKIFQSELTFAFSAVSHGTSLAVEKKTLF